MTKPTMPKHTKILASLLLSVILFFNLATPFAHAQSPGPWYLQRLDQWYTKVYDTSNRTEIFGERYTAAQVQWIFYSIFAFFANTATNGNTELVQCLLNAISRSAVDIGVCVASLSDAGTPQPLAVKQPSESVVTQFFADRPLSGITYFKQLGRKLNLVPEANAQVQGFGYGALAPVQDLWSTARNISFALLVFAAIILAFMVMFRIKLSPQVVVTAQSAIPKLIVAIVLIQFSYAIAGLMVDLMYVVLALVGLLLAPNDVGAQFTRMIQGPTGGGILIDFLAYLMIFFIDLIFAFIGGFWQTITGGWILDFVVTSYLGGGLLFGLVAIVLMLVLLVVVFIIWLKVIFLLFKTLAMVLLKTVAAPFYILMGILIPGAGIGAWIRSFASDLSVFAMASIFLNLAFYFLAASAQSTWDLISAPTPSWILDFINNILPQGVQINIAPAPAGNWPPLLGRGLGANLLYLGVSLIVLFMIPKAAEIIHSAMSGRPFSYGSAIGEAMGPITGPAGFAWGAGKMPAQASFRDATGGLISRAQRVLTLKGGSTSNSERTKIPQ